MVPTKLIRVPRTATLFLISAALCSAAYQEILGPNAYSWYQSGQVRVFFSADLARALRPMGDGSYYTQEFRKTLGRLFRSGVLNGDLFLKELGDDAPVVSHISREDARTTNSKDIFDAIENYHGPILKILDYEIFSRSETWLETITYEMKVTPSLSETGWGEFHVFRVTIKKRFLRSPKLLKIEYVGLQI